LPAAAGTLFRGLNSPSCIKDFGTSPQAAPSSPNLTAGRDGHDAVMRSYSGKGAKELAGILEKNKAEIEKLIRSVKGFVSYSLVHTHDVVFSVSVFQEPKAVNGRWAHLGVPRRTRRCTEANASISR